MIHVDVHSMVAVGGKSSGCFHRSRLASSLAPLLPTAPGVACQQMPCEHLPSCCPCIAYRLPFALLLDPCPCPCPL